MIPVHVAVPVAVDDGAHPSGGNRYDRELVGALEAAGRDVVVHRVGGGPRALATALASVPNGTPVLVDGLLLEGSATPESGTLVPLLHMPPRTGEARLAVATTPAVIATSGWTRRRVLEDLRLREGAVTVALPGVAPVTRARTAESGERLRCVAALLPLKGQILLVDALAEVRDLPWRCDLVGSVDLDARYTAALRGRVAALGLGDRLRLLGPVPAEPLDRLYRDTDLVVLPSLVESFGMVLAEAVACGIPAIAFDVGGVREALPEVAGRRAGVLVPGKDPRLLAVALRRWLTDAGLRRELTAEARSQSPLRREWSSTAATVAEVLDGVAARIPALRGAS